MLEFTPIGGRLIFAGSCLFVAGLFQGVAIPVAKNSRMALSGHLTAVQCGMALMIFGLFWSLVKLPSFFLHLAAYGSLSGYVLIWIGITIASITGASQALPIAGDGFKGSKASEAIVKLLEVCGVLLSLVSGVTLIAGLVYLVAA